MPFSIFEEINDDDKAFNHYMDDIILKLSNVETMTDANEATRCEFISAIYAHQSPSLKKITSQDIFIVLQKDISGEDSTGRVYAIKALEDLFKESLERIFLLPIWYCVDRNGIAFTMYTPDASEQLAAGKLSRNINVFNASWTPAYKISITECILRENPLQSKLSDAKVKSNIQLAFVFIDVSNIYIQGSKDVAKKENVYKNQVNVDLRLVLDGRLGHDSVIIGSCDNPPWDELKTKGFNTSKLESSEYKEKEVDANIVAHIAEILYTERRPGTIILLAGDVSKRLKNIDLPEFPSLKTIIVSLDLLYKKFTSAYGLTNTLEKRFLKINDEHVKVKYDDVMPCYEALDLYKDLHERKISTSTRNKERMSVYLIYLVSIRIE
ncbi:NYN domain-containing protein [Rhizophagus irregularis DAOM 181602=DAOM 197198]|nr:NYN domain-containing protein [Rhizophagus irregularis DAOM 181602=DAOM 197198]